MRKNYPAFFTILMVVIMLLNNLVVTAQVKLSGSKISGSVIDEQKKPLDYATILLIHAKDSTMAKSSMTDAEGKFVIENIAEGEYMVSANMVGYKNVYSKPFSISASRPLVSIPQLQTSTDSKQLKEVSIVAQKPFIERKMDKLIMNVENSSVSAGNTAMEVLEKAPGVTIDKDDNISMKGKQGVLIMLDGKQTYMSSADVANMLRNMQSTQIESIELITSPSAKYDAAGTSGIINIKTKKNKNYGLNGTLTAGSGYGQTSKYNGGTTLNYRKNKVNLFGNYNFADNGRLQDLDLYRKVIYKDTVTNFTQLNNMDNRRNSNSFKTGADYFINKNHTVGILVNGYFNSNTEKANNSTFRNNNFNQSEDIQIFGNNKEKYQNVAYNLNYKGTLDTTGKELSVDLDYSNYKGNHDEIRDNRYTATNIGQRSALFVKNYSPSDIDVRSIKVDYTHPINKVSKIETGIKSSIVKTDNDLLLAKLSETGNQWVPDPEYTNRFLYDENVNAAYVNFSTEYKKLGIQLGLRAEQTHSKGNSVTKNQLVDRNYLEFFPSLSVSRTLNKDNQLGFSYSRRIDRPGYDDLNPFLNFLDEYTFQRGNPYLNPQFTSSFDLSHTYKGSITTSVNYSHTVDVMTFVTEQQDSTLKTYATQRNLDEQNIYGLNVYAPVPVKKWWNINNNVQVFYMGFKSKSDTGEDLNAGQMAVTYNMDHSFTIDKTFTAQLSAQYQSPLQYGIFKVGSQIVWNAGLKKSFMNKKMNLSVNMNDIFNTRKQNISTTYQNMDLRFTEKSESQIGRISLSYRFGKNEVKAARRRSTGLEDETNRMKN
jgi:outer membrane receptor protein involved in Fe transport